MPPRRVLKQRGDRSPGFDKTTRPVQRVVILRRGIDPQRVIDRGEQIVAVHRVDLRPGSVAIRLTINLSRSNSAAVRTES